MSFRYGPAPLPDGEVLARMAEGWVMQLSRGVMYFGIHLVREREKVGINRPCFMRLREAGWIKYVAPARAVLTTKGEAAARKHRELQAA